MSWWVLEPRDPVLVRDGRPFGAGMAARSLPFPLPSTIAGTLRTAVGFAEGKGAHFAITPEQALKIGVIGPILSAKDGLYFPAPADCLAFEGTKTETIRRFRLSPQAPPPGVHTGPGGMFPFNEALPHEKPAKDPPAFWNSTTFQSWLSAPPAHHDEMDRKDGRKALLHDHRTHVAIDPDTGTAADTKLFGTDSLVFASTDADGHNPETLGLLVSCDDNRLKGGVVTLGGERRLTRLTESEAPTLPKAPKGSKRMRVILLTPALFREGSEPETIAGAAVRCAAVGRAQVVSGWDMKARGPKASRRMAPAGSVYWVELPDGLDPERWISEVHLKCVSDDEQDRRDGFGLAAVGVWGGA